MTPIIPYDKSLSEQAEKLALQWGFHFFDNLSTLSPGTFFLQLTSERLQLLQFKKTSYAPIYVDFIKGQVAHRRNFGGGKGQAIAKAVGLNKFSNPSILDATAGMGKDAFIFASLGARVTLIERSPIPAALLTDGLKRAAKDDTTQEIIKRMNFIYADTHQLNQTTHLSEMPDIIYLDPMYPHRKKSALVKKEMLAFQEIVGADNDSDELLNICCKIATKRVVVKRPMKAPCLNNSQPSYSIKMKKHRFDIYIC